MKSKYLDPFREFQFGKKFREIKADPFRKFLFGKKFREIKYPT